MYYMYHINSQDNFWDSTGLGLCYLTPLSTIFQLYRGGHVFLVEETGGPAENHRPVASQWQTLSHNVVLSTPHLRGIQTHNVSGDTDRHWLHIQLYRFTITLTINLYKTNLTIPVCSTVVNKNICSISSFTNFLLGNDRTITGVYNILVNKG